MTVSVEGYLVIGQKFDERGNWVGPRSSSRWCVKRPRLETHEVAVYVQMDLPNSLFQKAALKARITVADTQAPAVITAEVAENIAATLKEQHGIVLHILPPPEPA